MQLHSFSGTDGTNPSALIQAADGNFYGTTNTGGASDVGTIFRMTLAGTLTTLYVFNGTDGSSPSALIQTTDGNFYGTTSGGGTNGWGTVFKIMPTGLLTTLYSFDITNGNPSSGLIEATDGNYYGTTRLGGSNNSGTIFQMAPGGSVTTLHSFDYSDGAYPGALVQGTNGGFFGTTFQGGAGNDGTVFLLDVPLSPQAQIAALQSRVKALVSAGTFNGRLGQFLLSPLNEALAALDSGHVPRTIRELVEFIDRVRLLVILRRLTTAEGNTLIDAAESIITPLRG